MSSGAGVPAPGRERLPGVAVTCSHDVAAEWHEFERTSSAVLNAYVQPLFGGYLRELSSHLAADGFDDHIGIMQSNGGVLSADRAAGLPVRTLMSGPAGGVVACRELASAVGVKRAVCADVGGTTFDVALVVDGQLVERTATTVDGRPVLGATVDITSIGAGGGSVAWLDERGALKVGPRSAGAVPGPVCFGQGGTEPTVTDAQLLLGYLDPETFLGGRMRLDRDAAERALRSRVAEPLGLDVAEAAAGILRIAETNMANAIRAVTVARGLDPREFTLVGYGGGGGLFAAAVAGELGIGHVVVPRAAATFSAWGILCSDYHEDASRTPLDAATVPTVVATLDELAAEVVTHLRGYGFPADAVAVGHTADVRFRGQHHTVAVPVDPAWTADTGLLVAGIEAGFRAAHERLYGPRTHESVLEIVTLRARGTVVTDSPRLPAPAPAADGPATGTRRVRFGAAETDAAVLDRDGLAAGTRVDGAAVVCEWANTTVVPPGWSATTDEHGHLHLTRDDPRPTGTTGGHS
ncbi:hydantoinase/oxoprolinase family protein [Pseudonocardia sp. ICBG601]|uniref:hydantoinase/oxoprolinase family protein n=1 Tax=Pseudonocardia sp. ICBG601 TaxID=2846759 RepID=UPI001CF60CBC|nr:hydantoinase/oxoprolinase family protein [Pseudonocardia sp. ICBG601]